MSRSGRIALTGFLVFGLVVARAAAANLTVDVTNGTQSLYFTPLLITAHDGSTHLFQVAAKASAELQAMAEGGDISGLLSMVGGADADTVSDPAGGLLAPGQKATATIDTGASGHDYLSLVAMILPTNDGFVGLDSWLIPAEPGTYWVPLMAYDAGTEANDEVMNPGAGGAPGVPGIPGAPGGDVGSGATGVTSTEANPMVHIHPGTLGDLDPTGGTSDLDSRTHRWLNPVAWLVVTVK